MAVSDQTKPHPVDGLPKRAGDTLLHDVIVVSHTLDGLDGQLQSGVETAEPLPVVGEQSPDPALILPPRPRGGRLHPLDAGHVMPGIRGDQIQRLLVRDVPGRSHECGARPEAPAIAEAVVPEQAAEAGPEALHGGVAQRSVPKTVVGVATKDIR